MRADSVKRSEVGVDGIEKKKGAKDIEAEIDWRGGEETNEKIETGIDKDSKGVDQDSKDSDKNSKDVDKDNKDIDKGIDKNIGGDIRKEASYVGLDTLAEGIFGGGFM